MIGTHVQVSDFQSIAKTRSHCSQLAGLNVVMPI
jgi:hypothetical protein